MSDASAHIAFLGDGDKSFRLTPEMILELERLSGIGIGAIFKRLIANDFRHRDLTDTIRLALIGGGTEPEEATALVATYVTPAPLTKVLPLAIGIFEHLMFGPVQSTAPATKKGGKK